MKPSDPNDNCKLVGMFCSTDRVALFVFGAVLIDALAGSTAQAQSMSPEVMERVKRATVMVKTAYSKSSEGDTPLGSGTGFFVNRSGLCISNDHVTDPGHGKGPREKMEIWQKYNRLTWTVVINSGTEEEEAYKANVLYSNDQADMSVLQVFDEDGALLQTPNYLAFRSSEELRRKTKLWNLGFPGGESRKKSREKNPEIAVQAGNVIDLPRSPSGRIKGIWTNILANQGNSGGPTVDVDGKLVGIATLAGGGDTGRSAITILIPADLTKEMIRIAFEEGKVSSDVDLKPFYDLFVTEERIWDLPLRNRHVDRDCVITDAGSQLCGSFAGASTIWPSPLGDIEVPHSAMAYLVTDQSEAMAFIDGGDRFAVSRDDAEFEFTPTGANSFLVDAQDVRWAAFRKPLEKPALPDEPAFVISGEQFHLSLLDVTGEVRFYVDPVGEITLPVDQVARIERDEIDSILYTVGGSRLTGRFLPHELTGRLAWSGTPITFSFEQVQDVVIKTVTYSAALRQAEMLLVESLSTSDRRFVKIASSIDSGNLDAASSDLEHLLESDVYRNLSAQKKEEAKRLQGEVFLRTGAYMEAASVFKKLKRAEVDDVRWHARARLAMLDRYSDGIFAGQVISDPEVFERAARSLVEEHIRDAKRALEELESIGFGPPPPRREYMKLVRRAGSAEGSLMIASRLCGGATEELLVRLWRNFAYLHANEAARLRRELREFQDSSRAGGRTSGKKTDRNRRQTEQRVTRYQNDIEKAMDAFRENQTKLQDAGFIIDDSDRDIADEG